MDVLGQGRHVAGGLQRGWQRMTPRAAAPPRRRQHAAAAELPCVRRGKTTRACAHHMASSGTPDLGSQLC
eukprot:7386030-Prymnesium_polylepis.1